MGRCRGGGVFNPFNLGLYTYAHYSPLRLLDPDGNSTTVDAEGNVIAVNVHNGDLGVYQTVPKGMQGPPKPIGSTQFIDEFVSPETGNVYTGTKIQVGKSFDPIIAAKAKVAEGMDLKTIGAASHPGKSLDIKKDYKNVGALLNGKYATSRSAGNYLAGYNAAKGTYFGFGISFDTFQKLAGGLQVFENLGQPFTDSDKADIVLRGTAYGPAPAYGENMYQYRMSKAGWDDAKEAK